MLRMNNLGIGPNWNPKKMAMNAMCWNALVAAFAWVQTRVDE